MAITAEEVMQRVASVFLNDPSQSFWTDANIIPSLKYANDELGNLLTNHGISVQKDVSVPTDVDAGALELPSYPTDFFLPLELRERRRGATENLWFRIDEVQWIDPDLDSFDSITQWAYRNQKVYINPPTSDREILLRYLRNIIAIVDENTNIEIDRSVNFLASRTAELCARFKGRNPTKADEIKHYEVGPSQHLLLNSFVRNSQKVRRRPYRGRR